MKLHMHRNIGRGPFGLWPRGGTVGDVPDQYAKWAIEQGYASSVDEPAPERAVAADDRETADKPKPKRATKRTKNTED